MILTLHCGTPFFHFFSEMQNDFKCPCIVFTGHPSLRLGDVIHFIELWGKSATNTIIFTGNIITGSILATGVILKIVIILRMGIINDYYPYKWNHPYNGYHPYNR